RDPHLFVFFWDGWNSGCYDDGCVGWKQVSNKYFPRQNISWLLDKDVVVGWRFHEGNLWAYFNDEWIGYYPGSIWKGQYRRADYIQWYGEVATENGVPPQIQMGVGVFPTATTGGRMHDMCLYETPQECRRIEVERY